MRVRRNITSFAIDSVYGLLGTNTSLWNTALDVQCHSAITVLHILCNLPFQSAKISILSRKGVWFGFVLKTGFVLFSMALILFSF